MQIIIGKLNPTLTQGLLSGLEGYFHTEEDSEQVPISLESHKYLLAVRPSSLATSFSDDGTLVASVVTIPTTKEITDLFMSGEITEKELFDRTEPRGNSEALYLMSAFVAPDYRRRGLGIQLTKELISKIDSDAKLTLFAWPTSEEGKKFTNALQENIHRAILVRVR